MSWDVTTICHGLLPSREVVMSNGTLTHGIHGAVHYFAQQHAETIRDRRVAGVISFIQNNP